MGRLESLIEQMEFARGYTLQILAGVDPADWFRMPGGVTHVAWQVGHLAFAEYRLVLERVCGLAPEDAGLPPGFLEPFGRGSVPTPDPSRYPTAEAIRQTLDAVRGRTLAEVGRLAESDLDLPVRSDHKFARTRGRALAWCGQHELLHAGQVALLRRMLGAPPVW